MRIKNGDKMVRILLSVMILALTVGTGWCKENREIEDLIQAARSGDARAMCELGTAYYRGKGVLKDPFKAKCWVKQAHEQGFKRAEKIWNKLELWQYSGNCNLGFDDRPKPEHRFGDRYREPVTGMVFVRLPGKCFKMGCSATEQEDCGKGESPVHKACVDGFWMGQYEVTQKAWMTLMDFNPSRFQGDDLPVEQVSFTDARAFISRLNRETGLRFALPTEAQWEFACRNRGRQGPKSVYPWGSDAFLPQANCGGCNAGSFRGRTAPVGSFEPNGAGIYDMGGNVREWCRDIYDRNAYASSRKKSGDWNSGRARVVRGGSLVGVASNSRCRARESALPGMKTYFTGFRLVLRDID